MIKLSPHATFLMIIFISFGVLVFNFALAFANGQYLENEYYHLRLARDNSFAFSQIDPLSPGSGYYFFTPYHSLLNLFSSFIPIQTAVMMLGIIFGVSVMIIYYLILDMVGFSEMRAFLASLIVIFSPAYSQLFSTVNPHGMAVVFSFGAFFLYIKTHDWKPHFISIILFCISSSFGIVHMLMSFVLVLVAVTIERKKLGPVFLLIYLIFCIFAFATPWFLSSYSKPLPANFPFGIVSELGSSPGIGVFSLLVSFLGLGFVWKRKNEFWRIYIALILVFSFTFFIGVEALYYFIFIVAFFASAGIFALIENEWEIDFLKQLTLILVVCGFIFTIITHFASIGEQTVPKDLETGLFYLKELPQGKVLSLPSYAYAIQYISDKIPYADPAFGDPNLIFSTRNPIVAASRFRNESIKYVVIDSKMKNGAVWKGEDQGLLYALKNGPFKLIWANKGVEVWALS